MSIFVRMPDIVSILGEGACLLLFILPAYVANASPVLLGGQWPVDFGLRLPDGRPIFGKSKTWLGIAAGLSCGMLAAVLLAHALPGTPLDLWGGQPSDYLLAGLLLSAGALAGDLAGSFVKRRLGFSAGQPSFILDQLAFLAVALLFAWPLRPDFVFAPAALLFLLLITYVLHRLANAFAHTAGLKRVPW
ncbi:MAG: CDP-2,3-bis-(O-geranylgeranyl)-sn-glycerol synthase [Candidatus Micrarchaeota archaeon]|nr:CDP-2,3-bis-(O-geranylgeranyl)-sn-glycerol synthase [Candidatus Micrarchaeota archaeon]